MAKRIAVAGLALMVGGLPAIASAQYATVAMELGQENAAQAAAVARMVQAFVAYSTWPGDPQSLNLCVVGPTAHAEQLHDFTLADGRRITVSRKAPAAVNPQACQAVYMGRMALAEMRELNARVRGKGVLTIAEQDPQCRSQSMFCVAYQPRAISFQMNIDAISRSGVRVDPRVLRLAKGEA